MVATQSCSRKHGRGWEGGAPESDAARRGTRRPTRLTASPAASEFFFFFFFSDSSRIGWIRADAARFAPNRADFGRNRAVSAISGRIGRRPIRPKQAEIGRNLPKLALELAGSAEILTSDVFFAFFFLCFMNQSILMCFLRIF